MAAALTDLERLAIRAALEDLNTAFCYHLDHDDVAALLELFVDDVYYTHGSRISRGKAELDDKTMVDAMSPAVDAFEAASGEGLASALAAAADAAAAGRDRITPLTARKGRASYLGERSANHQDPGATSTTILFESLRDAFAGH